MRWCRDSAGSRWTAFPSRCGFKAGIAFYCRAGGLFASRAILISSRPTYQAVLTLASWDPKKDTDHFEKIAEGRGRPIMYEALVTKGRFPHRHRNTMKPPRRKVFAVTIAYYLIIGQSERSPVRRLPGSAKHDR